MSNENLDKLIARFYEGEEASAVKEDIQIGDEILASGATLVPDETVVKNIKNDISKKLRSRQYRRMHMSPLRTAIAAVILLVVFGGIRSVVHQGVAPLHPDISRNFFWGEDATASNIAYELEEIDNAIIAISLDEHEEENEITIENLEQEIMQENGGLWR